MQTVESQSIANASADDRPWVQVMRPGAMGDLVMATAVLPGLRAQGYQIRFVAHPNYATILEGHPFIDDLVVAKAASEEALMAATTNYPPAQKHIFLQYPFYAKRDLPQHPIPFPVPHHFCDLAGVLRNDVLSLGLKPAHLTWGKAYDDVLLIHTQTLWSPYKNWPLDRWAQLAKVLEAETGLRVLQLGLPDDPPVVGVSRLESPSILHAAAALKHCTLFIGLDSVFNHISRAVKKPSLILWGSTHPQGHGYAQNVNLVNGVVWHPQMGTHGPAMQCQPCYREYSGPGNTNNQRICPYTQPYAAHTLPQKMHPNAEINACMANHSVEVVAAHAVAMIRGEASQHRLPPQSVLTW